MTISVAELQMLSERFDKVPQRSFSLPAYVKPGYLEVEKEEVFYKSWQFVCHVEKLCEAGIMWR